MDVPVEGTPTPATPEAPVDPREFEKQRRKEQQKLSHEAMVQNTQIMFENLAKYLQAELQGNFVAASATCSTF